MRVTIDQSEGFTILELMIATVVFSTILLICTFAVLQISRYYYKALTSGRTQEATQNVINEISQGVQFSGGLSGDITGTSLVTSTDVSNDLTHTLTSGDIGRKGRFCINKESYEFILGKQVVDAITTPDTQTKSAFVFNPTPQCAKLSDAIPDPLPAGARQLVPEGMRLSKLTVEAVNNSLYRISVRIISGDDDLICSPSYPVDSKDSCRKDDTMAADGFLNSDLQCKDKQAGTQFCAVSELTTTVQKRVQ